jgi:hypothetical protein
MQIQKLKSELENSQTAIELARKTESQKATEAINAKTLEIANLKS